MGRHVFTVRGTETYLDRQPLLVKGLRCSNALVSDAATDELIAHLDEFASYGVNTVSAFFMGSCFGDVRGYRGGGRAGFHLAPGASRTGAQSRAGREGVARGPRDQVVARATAGGIRAVHRRLVLGQ